MTSLKIWFDIYLQHITTLCICWLYIVNICKLHGTHSFKVWYYFYGHMDKEQHCSTRAQEIYILGMQLHSIL